MTFEIRKPNPTLNLCPICGKPRGKRGFEFAHGKCSETLAKQELEATVDGPNGKKLNAVRFRKNRARAVSKRYISGKDLPDWMFS